jgi:uncharacterized protein (DUF305 family)
MRPVHRHRAAVILLVAGVVGCSSTQRAPSSPAPQQSNSSVAAQVRADSARNPYTQADVDFMTHMIGHHAQALVMAGWAPSHGASPTVRTLAERIINAQQDEIASMQRWLRDRGKPAPEPNSTMQMHMKMAQGGHEMLMPGMLTEAQMHQLDQARGPEFDRLFLSFMIQHHRGAVSMVKDLFGTTGAARDEAVFKFANDVSVDQTTEVARMERMLAALPPG